MNLQETNTFVIPSVVEALAEFNLCEDREFDPAKKICHLSLKPISGKRNRPTNNMYFLIQLFMELLSIVTFQILKIFKI